MMNECLPPQNHTANLTAKNHTATPPPTTTTDAWYDGSLHLTQPARQHGFRATSDAVLLAASIPASARHIWEFGIGTGAAALIVLKRLPASHITGVDCDASLLALAKHNGEVNGFGGRLSLMHADLTTARFAPPKQYQSHRPPPDHVMMNPPYNDPASTPPRQHKTQTAKTADFCPTWIEAARSCLTTKGGVSVICRTSSLAPLLSALTTNGFGESVVRPIHATLARPANRVLVRARKGIQGGVTLLPPLLCDSDEYARTSHGGYISLIPPGRKQGKIK